VDPSSGGAARKAEGEARPPITNTSGWSDAQLQQSIQAIKVEDLGWNDTTGTAKTWWDEFERENVSRLALVHRLVEELRNRKSTITEFFLAYVYSNTDDIQANLHYLDYTRLKKEAERRKRKP
jgi:ATP-dependent Clp protease ATP-binding subunit ClpX